MESFSLEWFGNGCWTSLCCCINARKWWRSISLVLIEDCWSPWIGWVNENKFVLCSLESLLCALRFNCVLLFFLLSFKLSRLPKDFMCVFYFKDCWKDLCVWVLCFESVHSSVLVISPSSQVVKPTKSFHSFVVPTIVVETSIKLVIFNTIFAKCFTNYPFCFNTFIKLSLIIKNHDFSSHQNLDCFDKNIGQLDYKP